MSLRSVYVFFLIWTNVQFHTHNYRTVYSLYTNYNSILFASSSVFLSLGWSVGRFTSSADNFTPSTATSYFRSQTTMHNGHSGGRVCSPYSLMPFVSLCNDRNGVKREETHPRIYVPNGPFSTVLYSPPYKTSTTLYCVAPTAQQQHFNMPLPFACCYCALCCCSLHKN